MSDLTNRKEKKLLRAAAASCVLLICSLGCTNYAPSNNLQTDARKLTFEERGYLDHFTGLFREVSRQFVAIEDALATLERIEVEEQRPLIGVNLDNRQSQLFVTKVTPGSPAELAGILPNDCLLRANGEPIYNHAALAEVVNQSGENPIVVQIQRNRQFFDISLTPTTIPQLQADARRNYENMLAHATTVVFRTAQQWKGEFEKGVPPDSMSDLHGQVASLMAYVDSPRTNEDFYDDMNNMCRQFLDAESKFAATVSSRQPQPDVAPEIQFTLSLGPINVDTVSGLKPEFNIPMTPITVGRNDSFGPKRLILRDQYGKERYFSLRHGFVFEYNHENQGFSVIHREHTLIIVINGDADPSFASFDR